MRREILYLVVEKAIVDNNIDTEDEVAVVSELEGPFKDDSGYHFIISRGGNVICDRQLQRPADPLLYLLSSLRYDITDLQTPLTGRKADIQPGKRHTVHIIRLFLICRPRVLRQHPQERLPLPGRHFFQQMFRKHHLDPFFLMFLSESSPCIRLRIRRGEIGFDVIDGCTVHQIGSGDNQPGTLLPVI